MKKLLLCTVCVLAVLFCAACSFIVPDQTQQTSQPTTQATTEATVESTTPPTYDVTYRAPLAAISLPAISEQTLAEDGRLIFTYTYQDISLVIQEAEIAETIAIDFLNRTDFANTAAHTVAQAAQTAYDGTADWEPFFYSSTFVPKRLDQSVLSLYGTETSYDGAPRSTSTNTAVSYDLLTGNALTLKDILESDFSADALIRLIVNALSELASQDILFADYEYVITELFSTNTPAENWYFTSEGLCFFFTPYEIAPYNAGTVLAQIPYSALTGLLKDQYFPAELPELSGEPVVEDFTQADLSRFTQFADAVLDEEGDEYLLSSNGALTNLRLEMGTYSADGVFTAEHTVFAAATVCTGDAVMIQATADTADALWLTYESQGKTISQKLIP